MAFGENDTQVLMDHLTNTTTEIELLSIFTKIEGPFAFVYYKADTKKIYFARDCLGRRSLLWYKSENGPFMLSSVGRAQEAVEGGAWEEVPANGIYCIELDNNLDAAIENVPLACGMPIKLYPWTYNDPAEKLEKLQEGKLVRCILYDQGKNNLTFSLQDFPLS